MKMPNAHSAPRGRRPSLRMEDGGILPGNPAAEAAAHASNMAGYNKQLANFEAMKAAPAAPAAPAATPGAPIGLGTITGMPGNSWQPHDTSVHLRDGGEIHAADGIGSTMWKMVTGQKALPTPPPAPVAPAQPAAPAAPAPAQPAAPAPTTAIGGYAAGTALDARMKAAGLRNGGGIRMPDGVGGEVPGQGQGDKIPAKYEPGEFVVSNDMLDAQPQLREHLNALRTDVLAQKGMTPQEADAKALNGGKEVHADVGLGVDGRAGSLVRPSYPVAVLPEPVAAAPEAAPASRGMAYNAGRAVGALRADMAGAGGVPGAVAAGGAALSYGAANNLRSRSDDELGTLSNSGGGDDTGLASAIMLAGRNNSAPTPQSTAEPLQPWGNEAGRAPAGIAPGVSAAPSLGATDFTSQLNARPGGKLPQVAGMGLREGVAYKTIDPKTGGVTYSGNNVHANANGSVSMMDGDGKNLREAGGQGNFVRDDQTGNVATSGSGGLSGMGGGKSGPASLRDGTYIPGDGGLSAARSAAAQRGDWAGVKASYAAQGQKFNDHGMAGPANGGGGDVDAQMMAAISKMGPNHAAAALANVMQTKATLRGQDLNYDASMTGHTATRETSRARLQYDMNKDQRDFAVGRGDKAFDQEQAGAKAFHDHAASMFQTQDAKGNVVPDTQKAAAYTSAVVDTIGHIATKYQNDPDPARRAYAADLLKRGPAALDAADRAALPMLFERQQLHAQTAGVSPFSSGGATSKNLLDYVDKGTDRTLGQKRRVTAGGQQIPESNLRYGADANHWLPNWGAGTNYLGAK